MYISMRLSATNKLCVCVKKVFSGSLFASDCVGVCGVAKWSACLSKRKTIEWG